MRRLRVATLITADPEAAARCYQAWFGYRVVEVGSISPALAAAWDALAMAGRRYAVVQPASGAQIFLRFIAGQTPPDYQPLRSFGWAAIELCVQDVQAVHRRMLGSPFTVIGPPRALDGAPAIWPMQVQGPDGEIIFLTEIRADEPGARLPRATCPVDSLFIAVLACADLAASRGWFEQHLALTGGPDFALAYTTLSRAFGLPPEHKHRIAVLGDAGDAFLQLDQYPAQATPRPRTEGELPPGIAMVSFVAPVSAGEGARHDGVIYAGARSTVLRASDDTLVELIA